MNIFYEVERLLNYWIKKNAITNIDRIYVKNQILSILKIKKVELVETKDNSHVEALNSIAQYAIENKIILATKMDIFLNKIGNLILGLPNNEIQKFETIKNDQNIETAYDWFFERSKDSYYIKYDQIQKNLEWNQNVDFGKIELTINLSKPPKTTEEIKMATKINANDYPKCALCFENVGFSGSESKSKSKSNLRFIPLDIHNYKMFLHFSPYGYFHQHLILNEYNHVPMQISKSTIEKLVYFVNEHQHFFVGSNSDIPIVGGSILSHNHFQGGKASFPIFDSKSFYETKLDSIKFDLLEWPVSTIRLSATSNNLDTLIKKAMLIYEKWINYENSTLQIYKKSKAGERQNAITPIVRWNSKTQMLELYILLRNNGVSQEFLGGIFHFHNELWNIKQENIGLIEAMGRAILPGTLLKEIEELSSLLDQQVKKVPQHLTKHQSWFTKIIHNFSGQQNTLEFFKEQIGIAFAQGLKHCGVFKETNKKEFIQFLEEVI